MAVQVLNRCRYRAGAEVQIQNTEMQMCRGERCRSSREKVQ